MDFSRRCRARRAGTRKQYVKDEARRREAFTALFGSVIRPLLLRDNAPEYRDEAVDIGLVIVDTE